MRPIPEKPFILSFSSTFPQALHPVSAGIFTHTQEIFNHGHDYLEIALVLHGRGLHHTVHETRGLVPGDVLIIHPGQWHGFSQCRDMRLCNCGISLTALTRELAWARTDPRLAHLLPSRITASDGRVPVAQRIRCAHLDPKLHQTVYRHMRHLMATVRATSRLGHLLMVLDQLAEVDGLRLPTIDDPVVRHSMQAIDDALTRPWGLTELAATSALSRAQLVRRFKAVTGSAPLAWINRRRAEQMAVRMLAGDTVTQAAHHVGWTDPAYASRRFKAEFATAPTAWLAARAH